MSKQQIIDELREQIIELDRQIAMLEDMREEMFKRIDELENEI